MLLLRACVLHCNMTDILASLGELFEKMDAAESADDITGMYRYSDEICEFIIKYQTELNYPDDMLEGLKQAREKLKQSYDDVTRTEAEAEKARIKHEMAEAGLEDQMQKILEQTPAGKNKTEH